MVERSLVAAEVHSRHNERYELHAYVIMNDHIHVLLEPIAPFTLKKILHSWKSFTAHQLQRRHQRRDRIWQDESYDRIIRDEKEFSQKLQYILHNPWVRWPNLSTYPCVWPQED